MRTRLLLACSLFSLAAYLRMRHGSSTLAELRLASPARAPPTKFLVLMMKGRVGSVWLRDLLMANPEILVRHEGLPDQPSDRSRQIATQRVRRFLDDPASVVWGAEARKDVPALRAVGYILKWSGGGAFPVRRGNFSGLSCVGDAELAAMVRDGTRVVCLARTNVVSLAMSQLRSQRLQALCGMKHYADRGNSSGCRLPPRIKLAPSDLRYLRRQARIALYLRHLFLGECAAMGGFWLPYEALLADEALTLAALEGFLGVTPLPAAARRSTSQLKVTPADWGATVDDAEAVRAVVSDDPLLSAHAADVAAMARDPAGWAPQPPWGAHALTSPENRGAAAAAARTDGAGFSCDVDRCHTP